MHIDELKKTFKQVKVKHFNSETYKGTHVALVTEENKVFVGIAKCNPRDQFNRRIGRDIAVGRAFKLWKFDAGVLPQPQHATTSNKIKVFAAKDEAEIESIIDKVVFTEPTPQLMPVEPQIVSCGGGSCCGGASCGEASCH